MGKKGIGKWKGRESGLGRKKRRRRGFSVGEVNEEREGKGTVDKGNHEEFERQPRQSQNQSERSYKTRA